MSRKDLKQSGPVTAHTPLEFGGADVFAVQAGVPFSEAMDAMALLLSTADETAFVAANAGDDGDMAGAVWAVEHLLQFARGLNGAMQSGWIEFQRQAAADGGEA